MRSFVLETIRLALREDIGSGDITSLLTVSEDADAKARIVAKEEFVLAGMPFVKEVFFSLDPAIELQVLRKEGDIVEKGDVIAELSGRTRAILAGERVSLNILQHVSGIAMLTKSYVDKIKGLAASIVDTRKTIPGMRIMDKYGVIIGGGRNHRMGLYDGVLIKDNHIKASGGVRKAIESARGAHHLLKIEVEVSDCNQLKEALDSRADVIMLDNMSYSEMSESVKTARAWASGYCPLIEASGNVTLENVRQVAETGVDLISIGALTHSARAVDISMKLY